MTVSSKALLPFGIKTKSQVSGGYAENIHSNFYEKTEVVNYHEDDVGEGDNDSLTSTMQSPITNHWVGGRSHRHVPLTNYEVESYFDIIELQEEQDFEEATVMTPVATGSFQSNEYAYVKTGSLGVYQDIKFFVFGGFSTEDRILEIDKAFTGSVEINISALINRSFSYEYDSASFEEDFESEWNAPGDVGNYSYASASFEEDFESEWSAPGEVGSYTYVSASFEEDFESW